ncbi:putative TOS1-like glycosyl hydrolase-domain-containing protein [Massariosphaeria phaeospora]|uniref:Putative TOS1-like glycosyl hydrolase-domain-containing protein n=1 Tax=Massariosphaeria phaeospora TaxID=100035 RepID=A0A7C8M626_9PLEO|nr:putative TOS1-like glycosyl hydrolase-domain-containing protein [Massariosphaeria phaeospora]
MHLRGPMNVSKLAVYMLPGDFYSPQKRATIPSDVLDAGHIPDAVDGPVAHVALAEPAKEVDLPVIRFLNNSTVQKRTGPGSCSIIAAAPPWSRIASYTSAAPAAATGFAFLANLGDERKSGTFDYSFGNSLGYVIGNGKTVASQNTPFDGTLETSEVEIAVFTDQQCRTGDCEARPRATAHYGFGGESKVFLIEFQMDHYDNVGTDQGMLSDAPAWWFLNAAIPRVLQYGNDKRNIPCSCWSSGCGEFDAFEVLGRGEERAKSTIHRQGNLEGGDSNFFRRPVGRMLKFAVIFHNFNITASVLPDTFDFSQTLTAGQIDNIIAYDPDSYTHSLFPIGD